ncbi:MAG: glucose-1-phosphate cytidylyltransferase [Spirochaetia bacterium]
MKVVILAGGFGTRLSEETDLKPKPMVEIGGMPILWHIMKFYSHYGFKEFVICLGYKGHYIKEYFYNYYLRNADVTVDLQTNDLIIHNKKVEDWKVTLVDTGTDALTGARVLAVKPYIDTQTFMITYGDGVSDVDLCALLKLHREHGKMATVTAVRPMGRFGSLELEEAGAVKNFLEKPQNVDDWINAGFFVAEKGIFDYIEGNVSLEQEPLHKLAKDGQFFAYRHTGFWQPMDTLREKHQLEQLWRQGQAPWKVWE